MPKCSLLSLQNRLEILMTSSCTTNKRSPNVPWLTFTNTCPTFQWDVHTKKLSASYFALKVKPKGNGKDTISNIPAQPSEAQFICELPLTADGKLEKVSVFTSQLCFYLHAFERTITCVSSQEGLHTDLPQCSLSLSLTPALILKRD